jgi:5-methylcytosine-specific restriction endonuclease McrA
MNVVPIFRGALCGQCNEPLEPGAPLDYAIDDRSHIVLVCRTCVEYLPKRNRQLKAQQSHIDRLQHELDWIKPHYERLLEEERIRKARVRRTSTPRITRAIIILRDGYTCRYCGKLLDDGTVTIDHILPVSRGGKHDEDNLVVACRPCNYRKKIQTPDEAGMTIRPLPTEEILEKF